MEYGIYKPIAESLDRDMSKLTMNLLNVGINMKVALQKMGIPISEYYKAQLKARKTFCK